MVKVVEKSQEERDKEKRVNNLEEMAKEFKRDKREFSYVFNSKIASNIYIASSTALSKGMLVVCNRNEIIVNRAKDYNFALGLAEKYEKNLGENWTLKKDYNE